MSYKVAINGFGRIGRNAFKIAMNHPELEIVAVNDLTSTEMLAYLLKHDSNYGAYHEEVSHDATNLIVGGKKIRVTAEKDPTLLPWKAMGVDVVIESTGRFTTHPDLQKHIQAGAKRVVLSAPEKGPESEQDTFVIGVNGDKLADTNVVVSNASCTTNNIAPIAVIINEKFGIEKAMMTTIHSYTASQALQDAPNKDPREGRNAAENIVPTTTGAATAAAKAYPALKGKFDGLSIRVPTPVVSLSDFTFLTSKPVTVEDVNKALVDASKEPRFAGVLDTSNEPLVSSDYIGNPHSGIVDLLLTRVVDGNLLKVVAWYDNEWGYSNRLVEQVVAVGKTIV
jgi:glyceraldehyde 3-phosphate dehydrogenase